MRNREYISPQEAEAAYHTTTRHLRRLVKDGRLIRYKSIADTRRILYRREELNRIFTPLADDTTA